MQIINSDAYYTIFDLKDDHWKYNLTEEEFKDIYKAVDLKHKQLLDDVQKFLNDIPNTDNIKILFDHIGVLAYYATQDSCKY